MSNTGALIDQKLQWNVTSRVMVPPSLAHRPTSEQDPGHRRPFRWTLTAVKGLERSTFVFVSYVSAAELPLMVRFPE